MRNIPKILNNKEFAKIVFLGFFGCFFVCLFFVFGVFFCLFKATPSAHGDSQARGLIRTVADGLRQGHSNSGSKPHL